MNTEKWIRRIMAERMDEIIRSQKSYEPEARKHREEVLSRWEELVREQGEEFQKAFEEYASEVQNWDNEDQEALYLAGARDAVRLLKRMGVF